MPYRQSSAATQSETRLHAEVALDYFEVRKRRCTKGTVGRYGQSLRRSAELTKNRFEGGVAPKADVTEAETQLNSTRVQASDIIVQRAQYEHALAILIGKPPAEFSLPAKYAISCASGRPGSASGPIAGASSGCRRGGAPHGSRERADRNRESCLLSNSQHCCCGRSRGNFLVELVQLAKSLFGLSEEASRRHFSMQADAEQPLRPHSPDMTELLLTTVKPY